MKKIGPWTLVSKERKYKNPWIEVSEEKVIHPDGKPGLFGIVKNKDCVAVLPVDKEGNVYLVNQTRYPLGTNKIEVVAGVIDKGESPSIAARRELEEELGIKANELIKLGSLRPASHISMRGYMFLAKDLSFVKPNTEGSEIIKSIKMPLEKAVEMVMNSEIDHWKSIDKILKADKVLV